MDFNLGHINLWDHSVMHSKVSFAKSMLEDLVTLDCLKQFFLLSCEKKKIMSHIFAFKKVMI
jgi:hypothetical protein